MGRHQLVRGKFRFDKTKTEENVSTTQLDEETRIVTRTRMYESGELVEFSINLQVFSRQRWRDVLRACSCHSNYHLHVSNAWGAEVKQTLGQLDKVDDVRESFVDASSRLVYSIGQEVSRWLGRGSPKK